MVLQINPSPGNARNSEGAFVALRDGSLLFAWTKFITDTAHDFGRSQIVCRLSHDGGVTWAEEERVLADPGDALNVMSVSLLRLNDGRILFSYLRKEAEENNTVRSIPMVCFSSDEAVTFSPPKTMVQVPDYYCVNNDRIIQLRDGRIVVPVAQHRYRMPSHFVAESTNAPFLSNPATIFFLFSDDGENWYESLTNCYRCFPDGRGLQEPGIVELSDGRLWSWMRTRWQGETGRDGRQWQSFSDSDGQVWSPPEPSQFVSPCSPLSMKRIPGTNDLLTVWNDHSGRIVRAPQAAMARTPLVCAVSRDDGVSWKQHRVLEDAADHGFCYTAIHFTDDAVLLAYCAGPATNGGVLTSLRIRRIPLAEIYR